MAGNKTLFLLSKGVSHTGTKLFTFALSWYILSETGSGLRFGISLLVNYLPAIVVSGFAGYISDRVDHPNRLLVLCDLASAAVCVLPLLHPGLASVYAVIFLLSMIAAAGSVLCALVRARYPVRAAFQYPYGKTGGLGGLMLALALTAWLPYHAVWSAAALCAINFTVGWLAVDINIQTKTTMQIHVDRAYLGKVLGFSTSLSYILIPLSLILGGAAAEVWPSYLLPAISGALLLAALGVLKLW